MNQLPHNLFSRAFNRDCLGEPAAVCLDPSVAAGTEWDRWQPCRSSGASDWSFQSVFSKTCLFGIASVLCKHGSMGWDGPLHFAAPCNPAWEAKVQPKTSVVWADWRLLSKETPHTFRERSLLQSSCMFFFVLYFNCCERFLAWVYYDFILCSLQFSLNSQIEGLQF